MVSTTLGDSWVVSITVLCVVVPLESAASIVCSGLVMLFIV